LEQVEPLVTPQPQVITVQILFSQLLHRPAAAQVEFQMQLGRLEDRVAVEMVRVLEDLVARLLGVLEQRGRVTLGVLGAVVGLTQQVVAVAERGA
jgi:hypothetical protein